MDSLASESYVFEHCYVRSRFVLLAPARASIVTGLYPPTAGAPRNRLAIPPNVQTIAQMVSDDYKTGYVGKWHRGDEIFQQRGFDEWVSANNYWWPECTDPKIQSEFSDYHNSLGEEDYDPEYQDRIRTMAARLHLWQAENDDTAPLPAIP